MSFWGNRNRGVGKDAYSDLKRSGRIGPTGLRTYHNKLTPLKGSGRGRIAYIHGLDESREDIVLTDGKSLDEIEKIASEADHCDEQARDLVGADLPGASAYTNIVELPREAAELTREKLAEMCNAIANELVAASRRGFEIIPTTWAVHRAGKNDNMHLHIVAMVAQPHQARPRLIDGSEKMMAWRQAVADRINEHCGTQWHGGTLADTGILDRPAKKRLPTALYKAREDVAGWKAEYAKDGDFLSEKTRKDPKARVRRIKLAKAANRVEKSLDDRATQEWLEAKRKREAEEKAARVAALRDPGSGAVALEVHQELEARGLTTLRRATAKEQKARNEGWQEGYQAAEEALQRAPAPQAAVPQADTRNTVPAPPQAAEKGLSIHTEKGRLTARERLADTARYPNEKIKGMRAATRTMLEKARSLGNPETAQAYTTGLQVIEDEMRKRGLIIALSPRPKNRDRGDNEL